MEITKKNTFTWDTFFQKITKCATYRKPLGTVLIMYYKYYNLENICHFREKYPFCDCSRCNLMLIP